MLTFFRQIRHSLVVSGAGRRYIPYALGEIALVMIGILLALQVNNWNQKRELRQKVRTQLENLSLALQEDIRTLVFHKNANEKRFYTWQHILKHSVEDTVKISRLPWGADERIWQGSPPSSQNAQFIQSGMMLLPWAFAPPPWNNSAINEMKNTGLFSELEDEQLKRTINRFYFLQNLQIGSNGLTPYELAQQLTQILRNDHALSLLIPSNSERILESFKTDARLPSMLKDLIHYAHEQHGQVLNLISRAEELLVQIESEI